MTSAIEINDQQLLMCRQPEAISLVTDKHSEAVFQESRFGRWEWFVISLLLLGIWLWLHPYRGIIHDSLFYVAQALSYLNPNLAEHDIFLKYGAQSHFNLFDDLLAIAIESIGLNNSVIGLLVIGQAIWLLAAFLVARTLLDGLPRIIFLVFIFSLTPYYGSHALFSYGEGFLTPRLYAEALVLFAITSTLAGRRIRAMLLIVATIVIHPLVALTGGMFLAIYWLLEGVTRWQLISGVSALVALFMGAGAGIAPFDGILRSMDPQWLTVALQRSPWIAIGQWEGGAFSAMLFDFSLLALAIHFQMGVLRRVLQSALLAGAAGVLLTYLLGDLLHNQLIIQLQLWRTLWLTHWFSYLAAALLLSGTLKESFAGRSLMFALLTAWLAPTPWNGVIAVSAVTLYFSGWFERLTAYPIWLKRLLAWSLLIIVSNKLVLQLFTVLIIPEVLPEKHHFQYLHYFINTFSILTPFLVLIVWLALEKRKISVQAVAFILASLILMTGIFTWDQRTLSQQQLEQGRVDAASLFGVDIPADAQIYWDDGLPIVWLGLERASYWNFSQGAAALFSRELAVQFEQRMQSLAVLGEQTLDRNKRTENRGEVVSQEVITSSMVRQACRSNELLDYIVLKNAPPKLALGYYKHPDRWIYYLYGCAKFRALE